MEVLEKGKKRISVHRLCCTKLTDADFDGVSGAAGVVRRLIGALAGSFFSPTFLSHKVWSSFRLALSVSSIFRIFSLENSKSKVEKNKSAFLLTRHRYPLQVYH